MEMQEGLASVDTADNRFPQMLYKSPGTDLVQGVLVETALVEGEDVLAAALKGGWHETPAAAHAAFEAQRAEEAATAAQAEAARTAEQAAEARAQLKAELAAELQAETDAKDARIAELEKQLAAKKR